jgi:ABC-2 type transport system permease protein
MLNRLYSITIKELIHFSQDRLLLLFVLLAPLLQLILIGGGAGGGADNLPTAIVDQDRSETSRAAATALDNTPELAVVYQPATLDEATALIDRGDAAALVIFPVGFGADLRNPAVSAPVQVIVDGSNVAVAAKAQSAAQSTLETFGQTVAMTAQRDAPPSGIDLRQEALYNQALEDRPNDLATNLAFIVFEIVALVGVMTIVREREIGTLEQVAITPVRQVELIVGKAISPVVVGLVNFVILLAVVHFAFGVPVRGSLLLLFLVVILYLVAEVGMALMISAVSRTQQQAITILFMYMMTALTMSGYFVPTTQLPRLLYWMSLGLPIQHFMELVRGVMLKGAGLLALWPGLLALGILDVVSIAVTSLALRRLH